MATRDHLISFAVGAGVAVAGAAAGAAAGAVAGVVAGVVAGAAGAGAVAAGFKPASFIAGTFTGLAAVGALVYALHADPAEAAVLEGPSQMVALENHGRALGTAFERADGSRIELMMPGSVNVPGVPAHSYLAPLAPAA